MALDLPEGFDPDGPWVATPAADMTPDERRIAAAQVHYEMVRRTIALEELSGMAAELAGLTADEIEAVAQAAEDDQENDR